jgi:hypothetical protein
MIYLYAQVVQTFHRVYEEMLDNVIVMLTIEKPNISGKVRFLFHKQ